MTTPKNSDPLNTRERQAVLALGHLLASREAHLGSWSQHDHDSPRYKAWRQGLSAQDNAVVAEFDELVKAHIKAILERELAA